MSKLILYGFEASPPTRACLLALKALQLPYELIPVNMLAGEQLSPEYLQKNPQHTVPMLEDGNVCIWDSHAIMAYLVRKYGKDDALLPKDCHRRAIVDQRLHFESGIMFSSLLRVITKAVLMEDATTIKQSQLDAIADVYDLVEAFLGDNEYIAGEELTIADFSILPTLCALAVYLELDTAKYPRIDAWLQRLKDLPYYEEAHATGAAQFEALIKSKNLTVEA